jgi:hypothetical protein
LHGPCRAFQGQQQTPGKRVKRDSRPCDATEPQFQRALKEVNADINFARSPQAKGWVERSFEPLQDRLVKPMKFKGTEASNLRRKKVTVELRFNDSIWIKYNGRYLVANKIKF